MLSKKEKIAYGLGDTASNIIFQTVMLFLTFFYTDIFGISPAVVGTLFLVVRVIDAVTDPIMGALTDATHTKYGSYRPYLLWLAIPFAVISVITFTTPEMDDANKIIYAFVTYTLLMLVYTAINIPYSALGGVLSGNPNERVSIQSYRFVFGMLGGLLVTSCTLPLVKWFGNGNNEMGYQLTMLVMSCLGVVLFLICFRYTKERVSNPPHKLSLKTQLHVLWQNQPFKILCMAALVLLTSMVLRTTLAIYYVKYVLGKEDLITEFVTLGMIGNILGCACAQPLSKRLDKKAAYVYLQYISAILSCIAFFVPNEHVLLAFLVYFLWCFFTQMATPLLWAKMADTIDYGVWQNGLRLTGLVYASIVFFIKLGLALGGAIAGWLLAYYQYQANVELSEATKNGILTSFTLYPAIGSVLVALIMSKYSLDNRTIKKITADLTQKSNL
ncbi:MFS transporter [Pseudoalteromonas sp. S1610]|jgi:GPH family glycoside/pentoside/hexuronide:cation symporter|uniref:glycoside-pentoside-hexuronide (GPH):cation symporter n=1 Tax=unclassified Pseudoalteromonas TaxID=194690 RepID=UPI000D6EC79A|nr:MULTISPECIES: glycoside-pentoside-hexuronide (GPH):cation symporter [unclassified Pseudoalteromonas]MCK8129689.1 glycoside-pentoside-hexuronide (GPH):cation symporter [Pseudoalteromonas sp. 2CM39R]MDN3485237.1 glycoside-pentoside-hexuronide (GPH):cation symporter [Pseudoalteromonas sp. APC 3224]PWS54148.1 MFS transporter [Pseudoalteromonas sp. meg-B1]TMP56063.1 MFS transporter [Pseudoalteromonas sp. S1612]TMP60879.1 MFS transporter [Pseudoalteromonas sp. S1610]